MSLKLVEVVVLGQVLRLNVPAEQEEILRQAARNLDLQVSEMKERTGLLQLDRVLSIVALNLSFELTQEKNKNAQIENVLCTRIQQLDHSLENALGGRTIVDKIKKNRMLKVRFFFYEFLIGCVIEFTNFNFLSPCFFTPFIAVS